MHVFNACMQCMYAVHVFNPLTTNVPLMEHPKNLCLVIGKCLGSLFYGGFITLLCYTN